MMQKLMLILRALLTLAGAVALLFCLSYPDTVLPPSADALYAQHITIYSFKPVLWLLPLIFMELVQSMGSHRNAVWFFAMETTLIAGIIAWPVLKAYEPEWVEKTVPFDDVKLLTGLCYFSIILFGSILFRKVLLAYLFKEPRSEDDDPTMMDAVVLDPASARTVRQIMENPTIVKPRFLFGEADYALISRFYELVSRVRHMKYIKTVLKSLATIALVLWVLLFPQPSEQQALRRDMVTMYEAVRLPNGTYRATRRAVHAAYRVMKYAADSGMLDGMSYEQAARALGVDRAPAEYRRQLLDRSDISLPSVDDLFESRTRFLTVQDGRRIAVLYVRTDESGQRISIAEVQDAGWNEVMDVARRRFGQDVSARSFGF